LQSSDFNQYSNPAIKTRALILFLGLYSISDKTSIKAFHTKAFYFSAWMLVSSN
jgi:hypothetical protein